MREAHQGPSNPATRTTAGLQTTNPINTSGGRSSESYRYERTTGTAGNRGERNVVNPGSNQRPGPSYIPSGQERYRYTRPTNGQTSQYVRPSGQSTQRDRPQPRYTRPENNVPQTRSSEMQNYSSPAYRQPKSSQEYIAPRGQSTRPSYNNNSNSSGRNYTPSQGNERRNTSPSYNNSNSNRQYTPPSNSGNRNYSTPSRSNSTPSYSTPSRSAPSNSSPSYSSPSRSSGGNNSGNSSGSSGSGSSGSGKRR